MKKISIITLFPKMIQGFFEESIVKRAIDKKLVEIEFINLRDYAINKYGSVDDRPYGGGAGMVLRIEPLYEAIQSATKKSTLNQNKYDSGLSRTDLRSGTGAKIILTSPKGKQFDQKKAIKYSKLNHLIIIAGHYEGVDERILRYVDEEVSLGDFVMTGGEITAAAIVDAVVRLIPQVLKKSEATKLESFSNNLLEYPQYTRPESFKGKKVPKVLLSGNHKKIEEWRIKEAYKQTLKKRKDLLR